MIDQLVQVGIEHRLAPCQIDAAIEDACIMKVIANAVDDPLCVLKRQITTSLKFPKAVTTGVIARVGDMKVDYVIRV
jgi:hypothetical protein